MKYIYSIIVVAILLSLSVNIGYAKDKVAHDCPEGEVCITNPLTGKSGEAGYLDPQTFIGTVISGVLGIVGSLALAMFIYGGFLWMTAAGNAEQVAKGKNVLIWATLGLVIIFSSYALVQFIIDSVVPTPPAT